MIGCKVMRTLASAEFEIILILGLPCCFSSSSSMRCLKNVVPIPFPEDPYKAIRQSYLVETETPESPHIVASPTSLPDSTPPTLYAEESEGSDTCARSTPSDFTTPLSLDHPLTYTTPTLVPFICRIARMVVRIHPVMLPGLSVSIAEVAAMSDLAFRKRFRSSYERLLFEDQEWYDLKIKRDLSENLPPISAFPTNYQLLKHRFLPEWSSGSLPVSLAPSIVPLPISSPMMSLTFPSPVASPATAETKGFLSELGARVEMQGGLIRGHMVRLGDLSPALFERYDRDIRELFTRSVAVRDEIFSQRYRSRSLKHKQERVAVTFRAIWRPRENQKLRLQIAEERRAQLDLAEIVDSIRRGQEPRGDV
ncbi:hypothetical protein Tco_1475354 [Tanacetum coccineum]